jgi:hypothetical protein
MSEPTGTPPGWYPSPDDATQQRYWDGQQWTSAIAPTGPSQPAAPVKQGSWFGRHKVLTALGAIVLVVIVASAAAAGGGGKKTPVAVGGTSSTAPSTVPSTPSSAPSTAPSVAPSVAPTPTAPAGTVSELSALQAGQGYLDMGSGFSRAGLIDQLDSAAGNGFPKADATWAVDHLKVDWNAQAVLSAKGYMSMGGFSRNSLINQLDSAAGSQFTKAQAIYAAKAVGLG